MDFRDLPSVDRLANEPEWRGSAGSVRACRRAVDWGRERISRGETLTSELLAQQVRANLRRLSLPGPQRVLNATGVLLHTGLGRARLAPRAIEAVTRTARDACDLELELESGDRSDRQQHLRDRLRELTGCEDSLVVHNAAGAVMLALQTLASGREVILSRGEMVEIGGSFRLPEIVEQSGCRLVGVGCTNRTRVSDYEAALGPETGAILRCHPSNFAFVGFHESPDPRDLATLARRYGVPFVDDAGSGLVVDLARFGLEGPPTLRQSLEAGADLVIASGDKLLGGPQCGLILGRADLVRAAAKCPLARALRIDKLAVAALAATLELYLDKRELEIPLWEMISRPLDAVRAQAEIIAAGWAGAVLEEGTSEVGGGALPEARLRTWRVGVEGEVDRLARVLRLGTPPLVGRIEAGKLWLDPRSLGPNEVGEAAEALAAARKSQRGDP